MPLGLNQIVVSRTHIDSVCKHIDDRISDGEYMRENQQSIDGYTSWHFVGAGELTLQEKNIIQDAYLKAGWHHVEVDNSSDKHERPGLWSVKLYHKEKK